ncbi:hypothetical protein DNTS_035004 [Danionella cerebrum]|uniref:Granulins domain-containing protein n=1 Tax=Danionella cerebrum TaxID=2873325 RepID=A0A553R7M2_9TELE|nr:hypothetical protein DNTS_035004 [Danionella translucida]TRY98179.1 hypothetical protein DNTS_035004 [Danionella translucida]TRY98180.1 hypothetical protein DNTS_035004 [Danionella translucida]
MVRSEVIALVCVCLNVSIALICPDGGMCEDGNTCCLSHSGYSCCPLPNAECCSDQLHCCYQGTLCDLEHSKCVNKTHLAVLCPDEVSECPDDTTCCQMPDGSWGCCPMKNAVCCDDRKHCCPNGTTCDLEHSMCVSSVFGPSALWRKFSAHRRTPAQEIKERLVNCNETVACAGGSTCCKTPAVCCEDHLHCCPEDTICNLSESSCDVPANPSLSVPWVVKLPTVTKGPSNVKCDDTSSCPGDSTCCKLSSGDWGCCPLPDAVCCKDHLHCCPHDTVCNLAAETCDSATGEDGVRVSVPLVKKTLAVVALPSHTENCEETSVCPTGTTCCKLSSGSWACCPMPQAVCCADQKHCCPQGYKCDLVQESCVRPGFAAMPWVRKQSARQRFDGPERRQMCDGQSSCPKDDTCCFISRLHQWGCCPLPKAVCCKDGEHCCPSGYTCNEQKSSCAKAHLEIPWVSKQAAQMSPERKMLKITANENVKCDSTTSCSSGATCCPLSSGDWSCCPLPKAVCCKDMKHCCPAGYKCDPKALVCTKSSSPTWWNNSL